MSSKPSTRFGRWTDDEGNVDAQKRKQDIQLVVSAALVVVLLAAVAGSGGSKAPDTSSNVDVEPVPTTPTPTTTPGENTTNDSNTSVEDETTPTATPTPSEPVLVSAPTTATGAAISSPLSCDVSSPDYTVSGGDIQSVINQASPGDKILVESGTYSGETRAQGFQTNGESTTISIDKPLTLVAQNGAVLDGGDDLSYGIAVSSGDVAVCGFEVKNYEAAGVYVDGDYETRSENVLVSEVTASNLDGPVVNVNDVSHVTIENINVDGLGDYSQYGAIQVKRSNDVTIRSATISNVQSPQQAIKVSGSDTTLERIDADGSMVTVTGSNTYVDDVAAKRVHIGCTNCGETTGLAIENSDIRTLVVDGQPLYGDVQTSNLGSVSVGSSKASGSLDLRHNYWGDDDPADQINTMGVTVQYEPYCTDDDCTTTSD